MDGELEVVWFQAGQAAMWHVAYDLQTKLRVDPADSFVIACAIEDDADHLYTTDGYLQNMRTFHEIQELGVTLKTFP